MTTRYTCALQYEVVWDVGVCFMIARFSIALHIHLLPAILEVHQRCISNFISQFIEMNTNSVFVALSVLASLSNAQFFGLIAARSASPIHLSTINANGGGLWIGKPQSDYCPVIQGLPCANTTGQTTTYGVGSDTGTLGLAVGVPGGQQMYAKLAARLHHPTSD